MVARTPLAAYWIQLDCVVPGFPSKIGSPPPTDRHCHLAPLRPTYSPGRKRRMDNGRWTVDGRGMRIGSRWKALGGAAFGSQECHRFGLHLETNSVTGSQQINANKVTKKNVWRWLGS
ncbi:uncharacterized protein LOC122818640 isoform X2 [Drosophila biarmipes]|nr:uncharacterized protein LOC122818640 isoform X2 [Drosophila biarmipes]